MINSFQGQYRFLSNFYWADTEYDGVVYPTSEHAYQAAKTLDASERKMIFNAHTPGQAKRAGRKVTLRSDWEEVKVGVMLKILRSKFSDPSLARRLVETESQSLVEGNHWHDNFWGVCSCPKCHGGKNMLGKLLTLVRKEIRDERSAM